MIFLYRFMSGSRHLTKLADLTYANSAKQKASTV
jgi:hypothetical protein